MAVITFKNCALLLQPLTVRRVSLHQFVQITWEIYRTFSISWSPSTSATSSGDFNFCALDEQDYKPLGSTVDNFSIRQIIQEPTHRNRALDLIFLGQGISCSSVGLASRTMFGVVPSVIAAFTKVSIFPVHQLEMGCQLEPSKIPA